MCAEWSGAEWSWLSGAELSGAAQSTPMAHLGPRRDVLRKEDAIGDPGAVPHGHMSSEPACGACLAAGAPEDGPETGRSGRLGS